MLHLDERGPLRLGLDHPGGLTIDKKQVVDSAVRLLEGELADRHAMTRVDVDLVLTLDDPARQRQLIIDLLARLGLTG